MGSRAAAQTVVGVRVGERQTSSSGTRGVHEVSGPVDGSSASGTLDRPSLDRRGTVSETVSGAVSGTAEGPSPDCRRDRSWAHLWDRTAATDRRKAVDGPSTGLSTGPPPEQSLGPSLWTIDGPTARPQGCLLDRRRTADGPYPGPPLGPFPRPWSVSAALERFRSIFPVWPTNRTPNPSLSTPSGYRRTGPQAGAFLDGKKARKVAGGGPLPAGVHAERRPAFPGQPLGPSIGSSLGPSLGTSL
ncbi:hypothetical protein M885DRAFT_547591 [Pelagophyceae sp. CCMP2097]|nr:hypothetical protein M885DRAFT_547591 [Pelagophyceae sp. CCMP2097]